MVYRYAVGQRWSIPYSLGKSGHYPGKTGLNLTDWSPDQRLYTGRTLVNYGQLWINLGIRKLELIESEDSCHGLTGLTVVGGWTSLGWVGPVPLRPCPAHAHLPVSDGQSHPGTPRRSTARQHRYAARRWAGGKVPWGRESPVWCRCPRANISTQRAHVIGIDGQICTQAGSTSFRIQTPNQG